MTEGNVEVARQILDALTRRDVPRLVGLVSPDVEWYSFFAIGQDGGAYRGHDGTRQYMADLADAMEGVAVEVDDAMGIGDVAVLVGRLHSRGRGSGAVTDTPAGWMMKFRAGRMILFRAFREPEQALEALGAAR